MIPSTKDVWPRRLYALDASRGIGALAVVLWHWQHFAFAGESISSTFDKGSQPFYGILRLFYEKGYLAVDYFFQLSGFIFFWLYYDAIGNRVITLKKFTVQRFSRLYPLHVVTLVLVAALQWVYFRTDQRYFVYQFNDVYHFILNLGFANKWGIEKGWSFNAPTWSVSVECLLYFGFFLLARYKMGRPLTCLGFSVIAYAVFLVLGPERVILSAAASFMFGGVVYYISRRASRSKSLVVIACSVVWSVVLFSVYVWDMAAVLSTHYGLLGRTMVRAFPIFVLFPLTICSLTLLEVKHVTLFQRWEWFGNTSYASYLLHFPLQLCLILAVHHIWGSQRFWVNRFNLVLFVVVLIALSYLTHRYFERPLQNVIRKMVVGDHREVVKQTVLQEGL